MIIFSLEHSIEWVHKGGGGVEGIYYNNFKINPVWNVSFMILFFFKEIITLAIANKNHGRGIDGVGSSGIIENS